MKQKIVIGIDFSKNSILALEHSVLIADKQNVDLHLVWVQEPGFDRLPIYKFETIQDEIKALLQELVDVYNEKILGDITYSIREGKAYIALIETCTELNAYLLVVGREGYKPNQKTTYGLTISRLMGYCDTPLFIIGNDKKYLRKVKEIVVPIDNTPTTRQKASYATFLGRVHEANVNVLGLYFSTIKNVRRDVDTYCNQVVEYFDAKETKHTMKTIETKNIATAIVDYCESIDADLLLIMSEQTTSASNFLRGTSYPLQILTKCKCPLLVIKPKYLNRIRTGY